MRPHPTVVMVSALGLLVVLVIGACQATIVPPPSGAASATIAPAATPSPSPAASAAPSASAVPSGSATPSAPASPIPSGPAASLAPGWAYHADGELRDVRFAPDGRIVTSEVNWQANRSRVVVLQPDGAVAPGWPWVLAGGPNPLAGIALGPASSVYVLARTGSLVGSTWSWMFHRLDPAGEEMPGFPVTLPSVPLCAITVTADGTAFIACQDEDATTGAPTTAILTAIGPDGAVQAGWPVRLAGSADLVGLRRDGSIVVTRQVQDGDGSRWSRTPRTAGLSPAFRRRAGPSAARSRSTPRVGFA